VSEYTLRIRRYDPQSGEAAYWEDHAVDMGDKRSVLDAILEVKGTTDGSIGIRCSCQQGICGSCGVRINGKPGLACNTHLDAAAARGTDTIAGSVDAEGDVPNVIAVEPMGNIPVIRDLIVDMDAVHWKKIRRVTPWLINKAYRFVGDPRDAEHFERLKDLSEDEHGIYDCTHCFNCIDACPKDVAPMSQIMRLRRIAGSDYDINDRNNGSRHEESFVTLIKDYGLLHEAELLPRSYGGNSWFGKFHPDAGKELASSIGTVVKAVLRGKMNLKTVILGHKLPSEDLKNVKQIYSVVEGHDKRNELNLYISGYEDEEEHPEHAPHGDSPTPLAIPDAGAPETGAPPEEPIEPTPEPSSESETT
jgi:succinate dehydrogenase / fumarate reductase iron-sulfur subunit